MTLSEQYDRQTAEIMRRTLAADASCVDVGCNVGAILTEFLRIAPRGHHYAFEPLPDLFRELRRRFGDNPHVTLGNVALSDRSGRSAFQHVVTNHAYSGLRRRRYDRPHEEVVEITVAVEPLDALLPPAAEIALIKIDVEGAELEVLRGAVATIRRCRPLIVFEHGLGGSDFYGTTPEHVHDLLVGDCGLQISLMADWLEARPPLTRQGLHDQFHGQSNYYFLAHPVR